MKNNHYDYESENPYQLADETCNEARNQFANELRPNFCHLRGLTRAKAIRLAVDEFFNEESPALASWLKAHGFLE